MFILNRVSSQNACGIATPAVYHVLPAHRARLTLRLEKERSLLLLAKARSLARYARCTIFSSRRMLNG